MEAILIIVASELGVAIFLLIGIAKLILNKIESSEYNIVEYIKYFYDKTSCRKYKR